MTIRFSPFLALGRALALIGLVKISGATDGETASAKTYKPTPTKQMAISMIAYDPRCFLFCLIESN